MTTLFYKELLPLGEELVMFNVQSNCELTPVEVKDVCISAINRTIHLTSGGAQAWFPDFEYAKGTWVGSVYIAQGLSEWTLAVRRES